MELQGTLAGLPDLDDLLLPIDDDNTGSVREVDDDDDTVPIWFRQISSETTDTLVSNVYLQYPLASWAPC